MKMAFWYHEGTMDFVVCTPALIWTFKASGSIIAGRGVALDAGNTSDVFMGPFAEKSIIPQGIALKTVSDDDPVPVLIWGIVKNITSIEGAKTPGMLIGLSGSGYFNDVTDLAAGGVSGSSYVAGKVISGSGGSATGKFMATINCMK